MTDAVKLTEAQAKWMPYLVGGHRICVYLYEGRPSSATLNGDSVPLATVTAMLRRGLIAARDWAGSTAVFYGATEVGRAALARHRGEAE